MGWSGGVGWSGVAARGGGVPGPFGLHKGPLPLGAGSKQLELAEGERRDHVLMHKLEHHVPDAQNCIAQRLSDKRVDPPFSLLPARAAIDD